MFIVNQRVTREQNVYNYGQQLGQEMKASNDY